MSRRSSSSLLDFFKPKKMQHNEFPNSIQILGEVLTTIGLEKEARIEAQKILLSFLESPLTNFRSEPEFLEKIARLEIILMGSSAPEICPLNDAENLINQWLTTIDSERKQANYLLIKTANQNDDQEKSKLLAL